VISDEYTDTLEVAPEDLRRPWTTWTGRAVTAAVIVVVLLLRLWPHDEKRTIEAVAVGNMACESADPRFGDGEGADGWCEQAAVSDLAADLDLDVFFGLGDYQYEEPKGDDYETVYDRSWGRLRDITRPALGNQEYKVHEANTFREYFGSRAGPEHGWYSYDIGKWRVFVLNSNCALADGCEEGSPQLEWLQNELERDQPTCTLAYWHHPRWSSGIGGPDARVDAFWKAVENAGVDLVLSAHDHDYQRFAPLDADGRPDDKGTRSFVVGTGGQAVYPPEEPAGGPAPEIRLEEHGVLLLTLTEESYQWEFVGLDGTTLDQGEASCNTST